MGHNIAQITDGIDDQIADVTANIDAANQEIERLTALIPSLQADLTQLEAMKEAVSKLSSNELNININVNGSHAGTMSTPIQYTPNI